MFDFLGIPVSKIASSIFLMRSYAVCCRSLAVWYSLSIHWLYSWYSRLVNLPVSALVRGYDFTSSISLLFYFALAIILWTWLVELNWDSRKKLECSLSAYSSASLMSFGSDWRFCCVKSHVRTECSKPAPIRTSRGQVLLLNCGPKILQAF